MARLVSSRLSQAPVVGLRPPLHWEPSKLAPAVLVPERGDVLRGVDVVTKPDDLALVVEGPQVHLFVPIVAAAPRGQVGFDDELDRDLGCRSPSCRPLGGQ
jgi:hypothetical protein